MSNPSELACRIALSMTKGMSAELVRIITGSFSSVEEFMLMPERTLASVLGNPAKMFADAERAKLLEAARAEEEWIIANGIRPLFLTDSDYPCRLADCVDAPIMLYSLGKVDYNRQHIISVVGTRHATVYGQTFIKDLIAEIARRLPDTLVVSGLAYGCDIAAHRESIKNGTPTAAVLAHGLSTIYPADHRSTAVDMIGKNGGLLTEYTHTAPVHRGNFLARNRIVAGMADATIVVESAEKGGAMLTARLAEGYGRDVFAVPGRISDTYSRGCNKLIMNNLASVLTCADDLFAAMRWETIPAEGEQKNLFVELSADEQQIIDYLTRNGQALLNPMAIDLNFPMTKMIQLLASMEFKGLILSQPGGKYCKA